MGYCAKKVGYLLSFNKPRIFNTSNTYINIFQRPKPWFRTKTKRERKFDEENKEKTKEKRTDEFLFLPDQRIEDESYVSNYSAIFKFQTVMFKTKTFLKFQI